MIRILQVASGLHKNGTETFIMNLFRNIDRNQIMFDFLLHEHTNNGYEAEARSLGANLYFHEPRRKGIINYRNSLQEFFKNHSSSYKGIHMHGNSFSDIYPLKLAKEYGIPIRISHSHNSDTSGIHNKILHKLNRRFIPSISTHFLACSEPARAWAYGGTVADDKSVVIPNGIDLSIFSFNTDSRTDIREELGIKPSTLLMCHTGNFRPVKNHPFLIEIFSAVKERRPDSKLLLCGQGGTEDAVRKLIEEKGLTDSVLFVGIRNDIHKILSASDVYIFPSFYEGLPFALIEAQASGIPVFASDKISPEIVLTDKIKLLSLGSPKEWADAILAQDFSTRTSGNDDRLNKFDIKETVRIITDFYLSY